MNGNILAGIRHSQSLRAADFGASGLQDRSGQADRPPTFVTAFLVGFIEWACVETLRPYLVAGQHTIGAHIYLSHIAPRPAGREITATAELVEVRGLTLRFRVDCFDEQGRIASGFHERTIADSGHAMARRADRSLRAAAA